MENKDERNYLELAVKNGIEPHRMLMIGNSVRSDIAPVVNIGGTAIHTPHEVVWVHEMMDMPDSEIHWNSNTVCGGKSKGYSLEMVKVKPAMADFSSEIDIIRKNSGTRW